MRDAHKYAGHPPLADALRTVCPEVGRVVLTLLLPLLTLCMVFAWPLAAAAQAPGPGAWLEMSAPVNWNSPGAAVPTAPSPNAEIDPRCGAQERTSASAEEDQVVAAGWRLFTAARVGWGLWIVDGLVDYDGMCRPNQFQGFVFADGQFAGTISPAPMDSRTDGTGRLIDVRAPATLSGQFVRYTATDPLCCPSSVFSVEYTVDRSGDAPLLVPLRSTRNTAQLTLNMR
ncbi:MAG: LppP/LprE family lipoprotein [Chloroflexota bacterium]|nr:LppP/LprE family lipoprotein [Chloroflexota bacterium]